MRRITLTVVVMVFVIELPARIQAEAGVCDPDPDEWKLIPGTEKFLHIDATHLSVNWSAGLEFCKKKRGRMLRLFDEAEATFLTVEVSKIFEQSSGFIIWHWVALKTDKGGTFLDPDGNPPSTDDFEKSVEQKHPNACLCVSFALQRVTTVRCSLSRYIVCEDTDPCGPLPVFRFNKENTSYDGGVKIFSENQNVSVSCFAAFDEEVTEMKIDSSRIFSTDPKEATGTIELTIDSEDFNCTCTAEQDDQNPASVTVLVGFRVVPRIVGKNPSDIPYQVESGKSITLEFVVFANKPDQLHIANLTYEDGSKAYIKPVISVKEGDDHKHKVKIVFPNVNESSTYAVYLSNGAAEQLRLDFKIQQVKPADSLFGHYGFYVLVSGSFLIAVLALAITWMLACRAKAKMEPAMSEIVPVEEPVVPDPIEEVVENAEEDGTDVDFLYNGDDVGQESLPEPETSEVEGEN